MKITLKAIIAIILSLLFLVSCGEPIAEPAKEPSATAEKETPTTEKETPTPEKQFEFEAGEGGLIVTKYKGNDKKVIIPSVVENKKVVSLNADVFGGNIVLEEIVLSEHMTYFDLVDFEGCDNLVSVTYPAKTIEGYNGYGTSLANLVEIRFPNAKSLPYWLLAELYDENDGLRTFDLSSLEEIEAVKRLTASSEGDLKLTLSESLIDSLKSSVAGGYLYEEFNGTAEKMYWGATFLQPCYNGSDCTKNHITYEGASHHVDGSFYGGVRYLYMYDGSDINLDAVSTYILDSEAVPFEEGLKSSTPFTIHGRSYGKYTDYTMSGVNRFTYNELLTGCAKAIFGDEAVVAGMKHIATTTGYGTEVIALCTVTVGDSVLECVYGHEFNNSSDVFLARRLVGNTSDANIAITYMLDCNSITINGTTYTANTFTPSLYSATYMNG